MPQTLPIIMDGATGTLLQKAGMPAGACTERWVLDNPEAFVKLQRAYVKAGSRILYAPTFGANRENLRKHKIDESPAEMCGKLVALSRQAAGRDVLVAGDISSTGLLVEPYGDTEENELLEIFAEQAAALESAGVDLFGIETQMYLDEARLAARAVRSASKKPLLVSFTCAANGKTLWGEDLCDVMDEMLEFDLAAFGINCCGDLDVVCAQLARLHEKNPDMPLIAKPNAGIPTIVDGVASYDLPPETLAEYAVKFMDNGGVYLGGCCGTDERHIRAIHDAVMKKTGAR